MKVEIFSDVVCPFCWIGKTQFELALEQFEGDEDVEITYRSFELDPNMSKTSNKSVIDMLVEKYSVTREQAIESNMRVKESAAKVGLEFNIDNAKAVNSLDSHRLIHFAQQQSKGPQAFDLLHQAYFRDGKDINDIEILCAVAEHLELDVEMAKAMLETDELTQEVRADEQRARELGVTGVPFFVINDEYGISGAQGTEQFLAALKQIAGK